MLTRCPHCQTAFRVTPDQLKARQGRVRCGRCQTVFDAIEALEDDSAAAVAPEPEAAVPPAQTLARELSADQGVPVAATNPIPAAALEDIPPATVADRMGERSAADAVEVRAEELGLPEAMTGLEPQLHEGKARRRAWPWVTGILLAVLGLGLQAVVQLRVELAVLYPGIKPTLLAVCEALGCEVPLPQKIDLIGIETSDLHPDPGGDGRLQLVAGLRNRAPFAQPWPQLEITLTDMADQALVRRVFAPAEYLPADAARFFAANFEQAIHLGLEAPGVPAAGYRLYVFYP